MSLQLDHFVVRALDHVVPCLQVFLLQSEVFLPLDSYYLAQLDVTVLEPHMYQGESRQHSALAVKK